jgi:hypothetical protein
MGRNKTKGAKSDVVKLAKCYEIQLKTAWVIGQKKIEEKLYRYVHLLNL